MDKLRILGGQPLAGEVQIAGAKNAALPILCAALLTDQPVKLSNLPDLQDVRTILKILMQMGLKVTFPNPEDRSVVVLDGSDIHTPEASYDLVKTMRASVLVLGPLLARFGHAKVSLPGGCAIGARPADDSTSTNIFASDRLAWRFCGDGGSRLYCHAGYSFWLAAI